jgi:hypothetical protein
MQLISPLCKPCPLYIPCTETKEIILKSLLSKNSTTTTTTTTTTIIIIIIIIIYSHL